jgi:hypothetical protein
MTLLCNEGSMDTKFISVRVGPLPTLSSHTVGRGSCFARMTVLTHVKNVDKAGIEHCKLTRGIFLGQ